MFRFTEIIIATITILLASIIIKIFPMHFLQYLFGGYSFKKEGIM